MPSALQPVFTPFVGDALVDCYSRVAEPCHPEAAILLAYWREVVARHGDFVVGRDVPARPIAKILRNIVIDEPMAGDRDMRVRLAGSSIRRRFGVDIGATLLSQLYPPADFRHHLAANLEVLATGQPLVFDSSLKRGSVEQLHTELVRLPIRDRDGKSPLVLVGIFYFN